MIAFDTETHLIKPGMLAPRCVCVQTSENHHTLYDREPGLDRIERALEEGERLAGHNVTYDLGVFVAERPHTLPSVFEHFASGKCHDTINRQKIIDNEDGTLKFEWDSALQQYKRNPGYNMATLLWKHFGEVREKGEDTWRLRYGELDGVPVKKWPKKAREYALLDGSDTKRLFDVQTRNGAANGEIAGEAWANQADWALHLMSMWGVRTNEPAVRKLEKAWRNEAAGYVKEAKSYNFIRKDGSRDLKKIRAAVEKHVKNPNKTKTGLVSTSREQLMDSDHPGLHAVANRVRVEKLTSTYLPVLLRGTEVPINARYNAIIETFRTSCRNPNLQNIPRKGLLRDCFVPRPGWVFVFCDYDTLEMLTLAQVCIWLFGQSKIAEAAKNGVDFHLAVAAEMNNMPYRQAADLYEKGDPSIADDRQGSKIANYGFGGGMGWATFIEYAKGFGKEVTTDTAQKLRATFLKTWDMQKYFNHCSNLINRSDGKAEKVRFLGSGLHRGKVPYTAICNGFFQHLAAMGAKDAVFSVSRECYTDAGSPLYGCRPWLFAHDEIGMEVPYHSPEFAHNAAMRLQELMVERMQHWCPDVPIKASAVMCQRWIKGAKPVVRKGLMRPSKPEGRKWVEDKIAA